MDCSHTKLSRAKAGPSCLTILWGFEVRGFSSPEKPPILAIQVELERLILRISLLLDPHLNLDFRFPVRCATLLSNLMYG